MGRPRSCDCIPSPENTAYRNGKPDGCLLHKLSYNQQYREANRESIRTKDRIRKATKRRTASLVG